jgi:hypothetical protein
MHDVLPWWKAPSTSQSGLALFLFLGFHDADFAGLAFEVTVERLPQNEFDPPLLTFAKFQVETDNPRLFVGHRCIQRGLGQARVLDGSRHSEPVAGERNFQLLRRRRRRCW